jgi:hypothetical protein
MDNPLKYFAELRDPRIERNREHLLEEILPMAIAAVLSGAESWNDIAQYGEDKREWLQTFLTLPSGIPSHDTFNRVFQAVDPEEMEKGFFSWVSSIAKLTAGEVVAVPPHRRRPVCGDPGHRWQNALRHPRDRQKAVGSHGFCLDRGQWLGAGSAQGG